jgi:DNA-binding NarL/FixJ family response regulator
MRVYLADEDVEVRHALRLVLQQELCYQVVGEAAHAHGLVPLVDSAGANLVLIEWELPGKVNARLLASLHSLAHKPHVVVLSVRPEAEQFALAAGADAFVSKAEPPECMLVVLRAISSAITTGRNQQEGR